MPACVMPLSKKAVIQITMYSLTFLCFFVFALFSAWEWMDLSVSLTLSLGESFALLSLCPDDNEEGGEDGDEQVLDEEENKGENLFTIHRPGSETTWRICWCHHLPQNPRTPWFQMDERGPKCGRQVCGDQA